MTKRLPRCAWCGGTIKHDDDDPYAHLIFNYDNEQYHWVGCSHEVLECLIDGLRIAHAHILRETYDDYP